MNMVMKIKEYYFLKAIDDISSLYPKDTHIKIYPGGDYRWVFCRINKSEIKSIFDKLEKENVIAVLQDLTKDPIEALNFNGDISFSNIKEFYIIEKRNNFSNYYKNSKKEISDYISKYIDCNNGLNVCHDLYTGIYINGIFLHKPRDESINYYFSKYVFNKSGIILTKDIIEREAFKNQDYKLKKSLTGIVDELGFKGRLRWLLFETSKGTIKFKNIITKEELKEREINPKKLSFIILEALFKKNHLNLLKNQ